MLGNMIVKTITTTLLMLTLNAWLTNSLTINPSDVLKNDSDFASTLQGAFSSPPNSGNSTDCIRNTSMLAIAISYVACFKRERMGNQPYYIPVVMDDYYRAIQQILTQPAATIRHQWILANEPSNTVQWQSNQCGIYLGATRRATYSIAPVEVAHAAAIIADDCLTEEAGFMGGFAHAIVPEGTVLVAVGSRMLASTNLNSGPFDQILDVR